MGRGIAVLSESDFAGFSFGVLKVRLLKVQAAIHPSNISFLRVPVVVAAAAGVNVLASLPTADCGRRQTSI